MNEHMIRSHTILRLFFEDSFSYTLQQWVTSQPGLMIREEDVIQAFPDIPPPRVQRVLQQMVKSSMIFPIGTGVYYKNIRTIEARGIIE